MTKFSITTPIFYVNGPPHIGHAYTVIAADVLARFYRQRGSDVFFLTGTDEHGEKIAEAASAAGKDPQAFTDEIARTFKGAWKALDIQNDDFIRTTEPRHEVGVKLAVQELHDRKLLYQKSYRGLYCTGCEKFLTERDLDSEGKCPLHNRVPIEVEEQNWFFKLKKFLPQIKQAIESNTLRIIPEERRNEVLGLLNQDLEDFSVSRLRERVPWGIPLPFDESQTVYVWVDALLNYLTALGYGSDDTSKLEKFWPVDVHLIGQDILKFHAVYWPALLLALEKELPKSILVHGFFTVNGQKISKSLGNAIDPLQFVRRYGSDATRFLLLSQFPFGASGDVQAERFDEQYDAALSNNVGNVVHRVIALLKQYTNSQIPDVDLASGGGYLLTRIWWKEEASRTKLDDHGMEWLIDQLISAPFDKASRLNRALQEFAPWKETNDVRRNYALAVAACSIASLGILGEPIFPRTAKIIRSALNVNEKTWEVSALGTVVEETKPSILFPRAAQRSRIDSSSSA